MPERARGTQDPPVVHISKGIRGTFQLPDVNIELTVDATWKKEISKQRFQVGTHAHIAPMLGHQLTHTHTHRRGNPHVDRRGEGQPILQLPYAIAVGIPVSCLIQQRPGFVRVELRVEPVGFI